MLIKGLLKKLLGKVIKNKIAAIMLDPPFRLHRFTEHRGSP